jgi:hypothetical protein
MANGGCQAIQLLAQQLPCFAGSGKGDQTGSMCWPASLKIVSAAAAVMNVKKSANSIVQNVH